MLETKPLIVISTTFDIRHDEPIIPGISACFASIEYGEAVAQVGGAQEYRIAARAEDGIVETQEKE